MSAMISHLMLSESEGERTRGGVGQRSFERFSAACRDSASASGRSAFSAVGSSGGRAGASSSGGGFS